MNDARAPEIRRVMVPGDLEKNAWRERGEQGIPMPEHDAKLTQRNTSQ